MALKDITDALNAALAQVDAANKAVAAAEASATDARVKRDTAVNAARDLYTQYQAVVKDLIPSLNAGR